MTCVPHALHALSMIAPRPCILACIISLFLSRRSLAAVCQSESKMKIVAVVSVLFALAVSQHLPCSSPKQWEGIAVVLDPKRGDFSEVDINYDLTDQKLRYMERVTIYNTSKPVVELSEQIFDYNQKTGYQINLITKTCQKVPVDTPFPEIAVPASAHYVNELWIGVENLLGAGFETELWVGTTPTQGRYAGVWSQVGCIPVMDSYGLAKVAGYIHATVYNVTLGIKNPNVFTPPSYC